MNKVDFTAGYKILPDMHLIINACVGNASAEILENYMRIIFSDKDYNETYDFIYDTREMNFNIIVSDMKPYVHGLVEMEGAFFGKKKIAGIYSSIHQLAYTQFLQMEFAKVNQPMDFFTDLGEAISWLGSSISPEEVEAICEVIRKNPIYTKRV